MAEPAATSTQESVENPPKTDKQSIESDEPLKKKPRTGSERKLEEDDLEQRLSGILCCAVCLDLPEVTVFQCTNGHLMCAGCFTHLLADARLKDEQPTCPNCRCEISKNLCSRNLAVEKAVSELPAPCAFCPRKLPRHALDHHQRRVCVERPTRCPYERIGCQWAGPFHELADHEGVCTFPEKSGKEVLESILAMDEKSEDKMKIYHNIVKLLSMEKATFNDLQLRPYRTDDFITKLYYETSRFNALNQQWVVKARVNDDERNPSQMIDRHLTFQLILKSRITTPLDVQFIILSGPFTTTKLTPKIFRVEFNNDNTESPHSTLPLIDSAECNKVLSGKTINLRLILVQVQK